MAEQKSNLGDNIEEGVGKVQQFIDNNSKAVIIGGGVIVAIVVGALYFFKYYLPEQNIKAQVAIHMAEFAFGRDSFALALNGQGIGAKTFKGFKAVADEYSMTTTGKLANFYAGICCLHLKKFEDAKTFLGKCSPDDPIVGAVHLSDLGDAYTELGDFDKGISYYEKAAKYSDNDYTAYYLFKTGLAYEHERKPADAKKFYEQIRDQYPNSEEGRDIEKYIARVTTP
jgi:tetratricopeptide (TPR) repeat protein